jgi:hypothetical protein
MFFSNENYENLFANRLSDDALKYNLICYVEKEEMRKVTNDVVIERFEAMDECRKPLKR